MAAKPYSATANRSIIGGVMGPTSGARTAFSIDVAYVHGVSGDAVAIRYTCPTADAINELYIFLDAFTGTLGNITMECDIYNEHASNGLRPGSTLRDTSTATAMPGAADKWIKFTFGTPYTPSVGEHVWFVVKNTATLPAVDFPQILVETSCSLQMGGSTNTNELTGSFSTGFTTTAGFSTDGTHQSELCRVVVQGTQPVGQPFTNRTGVFGSNTRKRGVAITGLVEDVKVAYALFQRGTGFVMNNLYIWDAATGPGGAALHTFALTTMDHTFGCLAFDPTTLAGGSDYYVVVTPTTNTSNPSSYQIEDFSTYSALFTAMYDGVFLCPSVQDDGAGNWVVDYSHTTNLALVLDSFVEAPAGGGGPLIGPGRLIRS